MVQRGQVFGYLLVTGKVQIDGVWKCLCHCGAHSLVHEEYLTDPKVQPHCGCMNHSPWLTARQRRALSIVAKAVDEAVRQVNVR